METKPNPDPAGCPGRAEIHAILAGDLPADPQAEVIRHLDSCPRCQAVMDELMGPASLDRLASADAEAMPDYQGGRETGSGQVAEIPGYRILETVGHGGEGVVYKAIDVKTGETVALKRLAFLPFGETGNEGREIEAARKLDHPGIVRLFRQFEWNGHTVLAMQWVEGGTLKDYLERHTLLPDEAVRLSIRLCEILEYSHRQGLIHRDLKPANVLLENGDLENPRLADFGLAKFAGPEGKYSAVTSGLGTPGYMPPEMVSTHFGPVGPATDIYSLGAILHETLVRRLPFESDTPFDMLRRTCDEPVTSLRRWRPEIPVDLETVCLKCLAKRPHERYGNVSELKDDLSRFQKGEPVVARRAGSVDQLRDWARRHPALAVSLTATFLVLVTSVAVLSVLLERSREDRIQAERSLNLAVDSMKNAAPIYKRFIESAFPEEHEQKNVERTARLCLETGDNSPDLRLRCESYFNALQMGAAIREIPNKLNLAESIFRSTLDKFLTLKANHEQTLKSSLRDGTVDSEFISELDMVNIRIAYCLIELAILEQKRGPSRQKISDEFVNQAIAQCEITLKENPTLDEAWSQLGNYLKLKSDQLVREGKFDEALNALKKSVDYQKSFYLLQPSNAMRWSFYEDAWRKYLTLLEEVRPGSAEFREEIETRFADIRQLFAARPPYWAEHIMISFSMMGHLTLYTTYKYEPAAILPRCEEILKMLDAIREATSRDSQHRERYFAMWVETASQLALSGQDARVKEECGRMERWLLTQNRSDSTDALLCWFRMNSPSKSFRSYRDAGRHMAGIAGDDPDIRRMKEWIAITNGGSIPDDIDVTRVPESQDSLIRWIPCQIFDLERISPDKWTKAERSRLLSLSKVLENEIEFATIWRLRCHELQAMEKTASNAPVREP